MTPQTNSTSKRAKSWLREMQQGQRAFRRRKLQDATRSFTRATRLRPERMEGWVNLGSTLLETGDLNAAEAALRQAITLDPAATAAHMLLGDVLRLNGRAVGSLSAYERAVELERSPPALNKLACALRTRRRIDEARTLYLEAIRKGPGFSLAQVNYATLLLEASEFDRAESKLNALARLRLPATEQKELEGAVAATAEYRRLEKAIERMTGRGDLEPLGALLRDLPKERAVPDEQSLETSRGYLDAIRKKPPPESLPLIPLPYNWPLVEGLFMIPLIETVAEFRQYESKDTHHVEPTGELLESINMRDSIVAARLARDQLSDPASIELHLRHWHSICTKGLPGFNPGHFKYTQNWSAKSPTLPRVEPAQASATLQRFLRDVFPFTPDGLGRAATCFLAICDLHCFADGNGRVALTWINRMLEWHGEMPLLFPRELGMQGRLGAAKSLARENGGDPTPVIAVMKQAQQFAREFCEDLAR